MDGAGEWLRRQRDEHGLKGVKFHFAYMRPLLFESVATSDAERIFNRITDEAQGWRNTTLGYEETRPLQDYLVHRLIEIAGDLDLTVVFHTGLQGNGDNNLDNCRPERLWNLISRYRHVRFNLLHSGIPWMEEAGMMAKYFGNVTLDMGWAHAISPELCVRALKAWIDMVPRHKILGFGGDYMVVEKVYGHLEMARDNIARALADKVADGSLGEERAIVWARALLHDNVILAYDLKI